jgi:hypothetical protein
MALLHKITDLTFKGGKVLHEVLIEHEKAFEGVKSAP